MVNVRQEDQSYRMTQMRERLIFIRSSWKRWYLRCYLKDRWKLIGRDNAVGLLNFLSLEKYAFIIHRLLLCLYVSFYMPWSKAIFPTCVLIFLKTTHICDTPKCSYVPGSIFVWVAISTLYVVAFFL